MMMMTTRRSTVVVVNNAVIPRRGISGFERRARIENFCALGVI